MSDLATIGHNRPPSVIELAQETVQELGQFLKDNPAISNEDEAREGKLKLDRANSRLESMETERDGLVRPLNAEVREINDRYRQPRSLLEKVRNLVRDRLTDYARRVEQQRIAAAEAARQAAAEAERLAREAEAREKEAAETAAAGVCDIDIAAATEEADSAFSQFQKASRFAQRAERHTKVRLGGGLGKVSTLRDKEILEVEDAQAALAEIGLTERIKEAFLTEARAFRKEMGELPAGIRARYERSL